MTVLIDTCIVIDLLQKREPFFENARNIFLLAANHGIEGCISAKAVLDIYYITHRATHNNDTTKSAIKSLTELFTVLSTSGADCKKALLSDTADYEDAVMIETAVSNRVDGIVTRNIKDYSNSRVPVYAPEDLLEILKNNNQL